MLVRVYNKCHQSELLLYICTVFVFVFSLLSGEGDDGKVKDSETSNTQTKSSPQEYVMYSTPTVLDTRAM